MAAPAVAADKPVDAKPLERADLGAAMLLARVEERQVEITGLRTEYTTTWANPDGTQSTESTTGPTRVHNADGSWSPIDATLKQSKLGTWSPAKVSAPFTISAGGGQPDVWQPVVTAGAGTTTVGWWWQGALPKPVVVEDTATFQNVRPGVDLVVRSTPTGFEQSFVLLSRPDGPIALPLAVKTGSGMKLVEAAQGAFKVTDTAGNPLVQSGSAIAWDARSDGPLGETALVVDADVTAAGSASTSITLDQAGYDQAATEPAADASASGSDASPSGTSKATATPLSTPSSAVASDTVDTTLPATKAELTQVLDSAPAGAHTLVLAPDAAFLADPDTQYPVTVDPMIGLAPTYDAMVQSGAYANTDYSTTYALAVGTYSAQPAARSFMRFDTSSIANLTVTAASVRFYDYYSASCSGDSWQVYNTGAIPTNVTWNTQPSWGSVRGTGTGSLGFDSSCAAGYTNVDMTTYLQSIASSGNTAITLGFKSTNEASLTSRHHFYSSEYSGNKPPALYVTYTRAPLKPSSLPKMSPGVWDGGANYRYNLRSLTPTVSAVPVDPDGGSVRSIFWFQQKVSGVWTVLNSPSKIGTTVTSGQTSSYSVNGSSGFTLTDGGEYRVQTAANDTYLSGPSGAWLYFNVDKTVPSQPTVSCGGFPVNTWSAAAPSASCSANGIDSGTNPSGVSGYAWSLDNPTPSNAVAGSGSQVFTIPNLTQGWHTLYAQTIDKAGNAGAVKAYEFGVGAGGLTGLPDGASSSGLAQLGGVFASGSTVTYSYLNPSAVWTAIPATDLSTGTNPVSLTGGATKSTGMVTWSLTNTIPVDQAVQVRACIDGGSSCTDPYAITVDRTGSTGASDDIGPGNVSLTTGNFFLAATDAEAPSARGTLNVARTYSTATASTDSPFGTGWTSSLMSGGPGSQYSSLVDQGVSVLLVDEANVSSAFTKVGSTYRSTEATEGLTLTTDVDATSKFFSVKDAEGGETIFRPVGTLPGSPTPTSPGRYMVKTTDSPADGLSGTTFDSSGNVLRIAGGLPNAAADPLTTCAVDSSQNPSGSWVPGCRDLKLTYVGNHVTKISYRYAGTALAAPNSVDVACYTYNTSNQMTSSWDPRDRFGGTAVPSCADSAVLATAYGYDSSGRMNSVTPPGQAAWTLTYSSSGNRLASASRTHSGGGTETTRVEYGVNIGAASSSSDDTHPDLRASTVSAWGQSTAPAYATAVFGPEANTADLRTGALHALDLQGREVNTATFSGSGQSGWKVSTTDYDANGNAWRTLSAANRDLALNPADPALGELGLQGQSSQQIAAALDEHSIYALPDSSGVQDELESFGPLHRVTLPDGGEVAARRHTVNTFGSFANFDAASSGTWPTDWMAQAPLHSVMRTVISAQLVGGADVDSRETRVAYALSATSPSPNEKAGWKYATPQQTTVEMGAADIITQTVLDDDTGQVIQERQPSAAGSSSDPGTRTTTYYASGTHNIAACISDAWFGQPCTIKPGSQPTTQIPTVAFDSFDMFMRPIQVKESVSVPGPSILNRTTTTTFDANGWGRRTKSATVIGDVGTGTSLPTVTNSYDTSSGAATSVTDGASTLTTTYDDFGRATGFTDADNAQTTTAFDPTTGRVSTVTNKVPGGSTLATTTYGYGSNTDKRGLLSSLTDSQLGSAVNATYDADGKILTQSLPNSLTQTWSYDTTGDMRSMAYSQSGVTWLSDEQSSDVHGHVRAESGALMPWSRDYAYDNSGRLVATAEQRTNVSQSCTTRKYGFSGSSGLNGNRTSSAIFPAESDGGCLLAPTTTATSTTSYSFDAGDAISSSGLVHDAYGRITSLPAPMSASGAASTLTYYVNDFVRSITSNGQTRTYALDPAGHIRSMVASGVYAPTPNSTTNHYSDPSSDSPSWFQDESSDGVQSLRRQIAGVTGDVIAEAEVVGGATSVTLNIDNLHGDVVRTSSLAASGAPDGTLIDADEFGVMRDATSASSTGISSGPRYGWLGAKLRAADTGNGLVLMGARLYAPQMGRFLQRDPVYGGNESTYTYPADPIGSLDLNGQKEMQEKPSSNKCKCTNSNKSWKYYKTYYSHNTGWEKVRNDAKIIKWFTRTPAAKAAQMVLSKINVYAKTRVRVDVQRRCKDSRWEYRGLNEFQWQFKVQADLGAVHQTFYTSGWYAFGTLPNT